MICDNFDFSLSPKSIEEIPFAKYENNFTFIVNGKKYPTNRIVADLLSPIIRKMHYSDSTINEFTINTSDVLKNQTQKSDYFSDFLSLSSFDHITVDSNRQKFYSAYFYLLGNIEEYYRIQLDYNPALTTENIVDRLISIEKVPYSNLTEKLSPTSTIFNNMMEFAAAHFEELEKDRLTTLPIEIIEEIICNPKLKLKDEDSLLNFIFSLYDRNHSYSILFDYVIFANVSQQLFDKFIKSIDIEFINNSIWKSIRKRIVGNKNGQNIDDERYKIDKNDSNENIPFIPNIINGSNFSCDYFGNQISTCGNVQMSNSKSDPDLNDNNNQSGISKNYPASSNSPLNEKDASHMNDPNDYPVVDSISKENNSKASIENNTENANEISTNNSKIIDNAKQNNISNESTNYNHVVNDANAKNNSETATDNTKSNDKSDVKTDAPNPTQKVPFTKVITDDNSIINKITSSINNIISNSSNNNCNSRCIKPDISSGPVVNEFKYEKGQNFQGIMRYLTNKAGKNIHDSKTIEITSNSIYWNNKPQNVVDYEKDNYYQSLDTGGANVCFDFKDKSVQLTNYTIESIDRSENGIHLKNWVLEVSNDNKKWIEIDRHQNDSKLNGPKFNSMFEIAKPQTEFYRYIRIRQIGNSWYSCSNHNYIGFLYIEFFGKLKETSK